jgi:UV DNA damage endonuclease
MWPVRAGARPADLLPPRSVRGPQLTAARGGGGVDQSIKELEYQAEVAEWIGADVINIHGGGAYGDKPRALDAFARCVDRLPAAVRSHLTIENDDTTYTPADLLPVCRSAGLPFVYDVHHHRCNPDEISVAAATELARVTWDREPLFHISSPQEGWAGPKPQRHHDFIAIKDFPAFWRTLEITIEVEARAKEAAVLKLMTELTKRAGQSPRKRTNGQVL